MSIVKRFAGQGCASILGVCMIESNYHSAIIVSGVVPKSPAPASVPQQRHLTAVSTQAYKYPK